MTTTAESTAPRRTDMAEALWFAAAVIGLGIPAILALAWAVLLIAKED